MHVPLCLSRLTLTAMRRMAALSCAGAFLGAGAVSASGCGSHEAEDRKAMEEDSKGGVGTRANGTQTQNTGGNGDVKSRLPGAKNALDSRSGGDATVRPGGGGPDAGGKKGIDATSESESGRCRVPLTLVTDIQAGRERRLLVGSYDTTCAEGLTPILSIHAPLSLRIVPSVECISSTGTYELRCRANPEDILRDGQVSVEVQLAEGTGADVRALLGFVP